MSVLKASTTNLNSTSETQSQNKSNTKSRLYKFLFQFCLASAHDDTPAYSTSSKQLSTMNKIDIKTNSLVNSNYWSQLHEGFNLVESVSYQDRLIICHTKIKKNHLDKFPLIIKKRASIQENIENELAYLLMTFRQSEPHSAILVDVPYEGADFQLKKLEPTGTQQVLFNLSVFDMPHSYFSRQDSIQLQSSSMIESSNYLFERDNLKLDCLVSKSGLHSRVLGIFDEIVLVPVWKNKVGIHLCGLNQQLSIQKKSQIVNQILHYEGEIGSLRLLLPAEIQANDIVHILSIFQELRQLRDKKQIVYQMREIQFTKSEFVEITFREEKETSVMKFVASESMQKVCVNPSFEQLWVFQKILGELDGYRTLELLHLCAQGKACSDMKEFAGVLKRVNVSSQLIRELQERVSLKVEKAVKSSQNVTPKDLSFQLSEQLSSYGVTSQLESKERVEGRSGYVIESLGSLSSQLEES